MQRVDANVGCKGWMQSVYLIHDLVTLVVLALLLPRLLVENCFQLIDLNLSHLAESKCVRGWEEGIY
jgi:hypothetical protein